MMRSIVATVVTTASHWETTTNSQLFEVVIRSPIAKQVQDRAHSYRLGAEAVIAETTEFA
jgi:hypothetical protein